MECKKYQKLISKEIDDEISADEKELLNRHLNQCTECRQFKAFLISVSGAYRRIEDVEPPSSVLEGIMSGIHEENNVLRLTRWAKLAVSAAAVFVMFIGAGVGNFLAERSTPDVNPLEDNIFQVEYLGDYPPGSVGHLLANVMEGGENEE